METFSDGLTAYSLSGDLVAYSSSGNFTNWKYWGNSIRPLGPCQNNGSVTACRMKHAPILSASMNI